MARRDTSGVLRVGQRDLARVAQQPPAAQPTLARLLADGLWILFFIVASYAANQLRAYDVERWAWLGADIAAFAVILLRPDEMLGLIRRNLVIMSWPLLACVSTLWSLNPAISLYQGAQLLLTVLVALCLCMTADLRRIMVLLFLALVATGVLSLLSELADKANSGGEWRGVFPHKNVLGSMMAVTVITGTSLFLAGWRPFISGPGVIFALGLLAMSRSGTAIVALAVTMALVPLALTIRWGPIAVSMASGLVLIAASVGLMTVEIIHADLFDLYEGALDALGKDETLTGRTILWQFAEDAINARPWLGFGYKAWWASSETPAALLRLVMDQDLWFFHNTFLELAVAFGILGPAVLVAGLGFGVYRSVRTFALDPDPLLLWPILFVAMSIIYCSVEFVLFANHSFHQFLFVIAAAGLTRAKKEVRTPAAQSPSQTSGLPRSVLP